MGGQRYLSTLVYSALYQLDVLLNQICEKKKLSMIVFFFRNFGLMM